MKTIVVVDDDVMIAMELCGTIHNKFKEYRCIAVTSAINALEEISELLSNGNTLAAIISDWDMKDVHGDDLLMRIKNIYPNTKTIMMTAYTNPKLISESKKCIDHLFKKDFDMTNIYTIIRDLKE